MYLNLKNILRTNILLKTISCIAGCIFWYIISQSHMTTMTMTIPVCFYGTQPHTTIEAPPTITVTMQGKRSDLQNIDPHTLACHINGATLHKGPNPLIISNHHLFLPDRITVVSWSPMQNIITVQETNSTPMAQSA